MDAQFFDGFAADIHSEKAWREFNNSFRNEKKKLKDTANPTQLGDHVSLKAEAAESTPTNQDRGAQSSRLSSSRSSNPKLSEAQGDGQRPSLSKLAKDTTIGDPVSLESEEVVESDKARNSQGPLSGKQRSGTPQSSSNHSGLPPIPKLDAEKLFWAIMSASGEPDPYVFPALERLQKQKSRPILGALSNTVIFPKDYPWSKAKGLSSPKLGSGAFFFDPATFFDVYVASAEVGMRKPSKEIYELTLRRLSDYDKQKGGPGIKPEDVVFLDDIGENLKTAKEVGMRTIRVQLEKTWRAVKELEGMLGIELMDEKTRRAKL